MLLLQAVNTVLAVLAIASMQLACCCSVAQVQLERQRCAAAGCCCCRWVHQPSSRGPWQWGCCNSRTRCSVAPAVSRFSRLQLHWLVTTETSPACCCSLLLLPVSLQFFEQWFVALGMQWFPNTVQQRSPNSSRLAACALPCDHDPAPAAMRMAGHSHYQRPTLESRGGHAHHAGCNSPVGQPSGPHQLQWGAVQVLGRGSRCAAPSPRNIRRRRSSPFAMPAASHAPPASAVALLIRTLTA